MSSWSVFYTAGEVPRVLVGTRCTNEQKIFASNKNMHLSPRTTGGRAKHSKPKIVCRLWPYIWGLGELRSCWKGREGVGKWRAVAHEVLVMFILRRQQDDIFMQQRHADMCGWRLLLACHHCINMI